MKSLFWKYLSVTVALLLTSFLLSGTFFVWHSYSASVDSTREQLELKTKNLASITQLLLTNDSSVVRQMYYDAVNQIFDSGSNVIICSTGGRLLFYVDSDGLREGALEFIDADIMDEIKADGSYYQIGDLGGALSGRYYTSGALISYANGSEFVLFVSIPTSGTFDEIEDMQRTFFVYAAFILFVAIIVSYFVAQSISVPLKKMINVTRSYAKGDFSPKVQENRDDEIGELAHAINQMSASLGKLEELRSSFIANVSHELKTPMTTITGFVDGILDGTIPPERQEEYLRRISADTRRLSRLVIRMLQASRIESGQTQIHPSRFDLCETIRQTILSFEQVLTNKKIDVQIEFEQEDMYVMADPDSTIQVVSNLIDNACKFTPEGGTLAINVEKSGSKLVTTIANTGTIPEEKLPYLFDRFYKADSSRGMDANGAGLGLFIVKSILKMHGESIEARSENGLAKFIFTLPAVE